MLYSHYYVAKETGTSADVLIVYGLAKLLSDIRGSKGLKLIDMGGFYCISLDSPLTQSQIDLASFTMYCPGIIVTTAKKGRQEVNVPNPIDYEEQRQKNELFHTSLGDQDNDDSHDNAIERPHPDWAIWVAINHMSAMTTYNQLVELWYAHRDCFPELLRILLSLYSSKTNGEDAAIQKWKQLAKESKITTKVPNSRLQVVNPSMGKGFNQNKADGLPSQPSGSKGFWLPEYLRYVGFYEAAIPRLVKAEEVDKADRKTYVPIPRELAWLTHRQVFNEFRQRLFSHTSTQMDILGALRYCQIFLEQWRDGQGEDGFLELLSGIPNDHVAAIEITHYKKLRAFATINLSVFALPVWLRQVETVEQANQYIALVEEHIRVVRQRHPQERKGTEYDFLRDYRDFLSSYQLQPFFHFMLKYSQHLMSELGDGKNPAQFTTKGLEVMLMNHPDSEKLTPIVINPSFQRIANAIRASTVTAQFFKAKGEPGPYDIRYGLGNKLTRNATYPGKFFVALNEFVASYMQENARVNEHYKGNPPVSRTQIRDEDLQEIAKLIDDYGSELVAHSLVAFGYASKSSDKS